MSSDSYTHFRVAKIEPSDPTPESSIDFLLLRRLCSHASCRDFFDPRSRRTHSLPPFPTPSPLTLPIWRFLRSLQHATTPLDRSVTMFMYGRIAAFALSPDLPRGLSCGCRVSSSSFSSQINCAVSYEERWRRKMEANRMKLDELQLHHLSVAVREATAATEPSPMNPLV